MITLKKTAQTLVPVKYLQAECGVRYWEDATVDGVQDTDGSRIPCRKTEPNTHLGGGTWEPLIDLETGKIVNWKVGIVANVHYKVCDDGAYHLLDADKSVVASINGYVPDMMAPCGQGYGDYVIMQIATDGQIANWKVRLDEFKKQDDED